MALLDHLIPQDSRPLTGMLSDNATCRLPLRTRPPPSPSCLGCFSNGCLHPERGGNHLQRPDLSVHFCELISMNSRSAPPWTPPSRLTRPLQNRAGTFFSLLGSSTLSSQPQTFLQGLFPAPAFTPLGVPLVFQDPLPYPLPRTHCQLPTETSDPGIQAPGETATLQPLRT